MLKIHIDLSEVVQFLKADIIVISVHFNLLFLFVISHVLSPKGVPWMDVKPGFWDPENASPKQRFPYNRVNRYKNYVNIFPAPNFLSPQWWCPLNRVVSKERLHCIVNVDTQFVWLQWASFELLQFIIVSEAEEV